MKTTIKFAAVAVVLLAASGPSAAASTNWMTMNQMKSLFNSWGGGKDGPVATAYATAIDCKDDGNGPQFKVTYKLIKSMSGTKPFHRWNWVFTKSSDLAKAVAKLKVSDEKHLKYRVVQQSSYTGSNGVEMICAIAYR